MKRYLPHIALAFLDVYVCPIDVPFLICLLLVSGSMFCCWSCSYCLLLDLACSFGFQICFITSVSSRLLPIAKVHLCQQSFFLILSLILFCCLFACWSSLLTLAVVLILIRNMKTAMFSCDSPHKKCTDCRNLQLAATLVCTRVNVAKARDALSKCFKLRLFYPGQRSHVLVSIANFLV